MSRLDPDLVLRSVGRRVAELRSGTQEELAERLGVSIKYLQRIEAGRPNLTIRSLVRIANAPSGPGLMSVHLAIYPAALSPVLNSTESSATF